MTQTQSIMESEAYEAPLRIGQQFMANTSIMMDLAKRLQKMQPPLVLTIGRGSSDHAGVFAKYLFEIETGIPTVSAAPSVVSIYQKQLRLKNAVAFVISQSGSSPDILVQAEMAKSCGALCVAIVNDLQSPLCTIADIILPMHVGSEHAVAATKSYLASLSVFLHLTSMWAKNRPLIKALNSFADDLGRILNESANFDLSSIVQAKNCIVLGRGFGYAIGLEIALKLKEIFAIQAEAFSSAEFLHGPAALAKNDLSLLSIVVNDESKASHCEQLKKVLHTGIRLLTLEQSHENLHPRLAPLTLVQKFYLQAARVAVKQGYNPDSPPGLQKVTRTI